VEAAEFGFEVGPLLPLDFIGLVFKSERLANSVLPPSVLPPMRTGTSVTKKLSSMPTMTWSGGAVSTLRQIAFSSS
jgi:hypothetical protein